jgi:hypothetical protein
MDPLTGLSEGERISQIAHRLPRIPVEGFSLTIQVVAYLVCALATVVVGLRVYVKLWQNGSQRAWGWEDTFAVGGWVWKCSLSRPPTPFLFYFFFNCLTSEQG